MKWYHFAVNYHDLWINSNFLFYIRHDHGDSFSSKVLEESVQWNPFYDDIENISNLETLMFSDSADRK